MKKLLAVALLLFATSAFGWEDTDSPEGHIESAGNNADGDTIAFTTTVITDIQGTAHKGGADQLAADAKGIVYSIYIGWDRTRSADIDAGDIPPNAASTLNGSINDAVTTLTVASATFFYNEGIVRIGVEAIAYTGKTATTLTGCTRGYNETDASPHTTGDAVTSVAGFDLVTTVICDGSPYSAIGWDVGASPADDGTEGNLLQDGTTITLTKHRSYLIKIRVLDGNGNTNTEVTGVDTFNTYTSGCYVDEDGDVTQGLEDDEVWQFYSAKRPAIN